MIELRLLGSLELTASDGSQILSVLSQPKRASILAYLAAAAPRGFHRRDKLMALFWPEADDEHAHGSLRQALHFLKRSLGEAALLRLGDDEVGIDPDLVWVDVAAFDAAVEAEDLHGALSLYRGDLLAGFHLPDAPDFERWVDSEGQRLRNRAVSAGERLRDQTAESGDLAGATEIARRVVELTPANGQAVRRLVEILARRGDRAGAIHAYQSFAERLHDDFEMEPPDQLRELIGEIRSGSTAASVASGTMPATSPAQVVPDTQAPPPGLALGSVTAAGGPVRRARVWNAPLLIGFAVALLALGYGVFGRGRTTVRADGVLRVLVVPLTDFSPDQSLGQATLGLTEEITTALGRSRRIAPIARTTAVKLTQEGLDPTDVGASVHVDYVVAGSLRGVGDLLRASVQLISTESRTEVWSGRYVLSDGGDLRQEERIARDVARQIELAISSAADGDLATRGAAETDVEEAYLAHWYGRALWHQRQPALFQAALAHYERAIELDDDYALAYSAIADVYNLLGAYDYGLMPPDQAIPLAASAARQAIARAPDLGEAFASLGVTHLSYDWDLEKSRDAFYKAMDLSPTYASAHHWYSLQLIAEGDMEGSRTHIEQARILEPTSQIMRSSLARNHYYHRAYSQAIAHYRDALDVDPDLPPARIGLGLSLLLDGQAEEAMRQYDAAREILGDSSALVLSLQGHLYGTQGDLDSARQVLETLDGYPWVPAEYFGIVHLGMGNIDRALGFFEQAYQERSGAMVFIHVDPMLDPLIDHPRWDALIALVGIAEN